MKGSGRLKLARIYTRTRVDLVLAGLALIAIWLMFTASEDPLVPWLRGTRLGHALLQFETGNQVVFDLAIGVLSAIAMFYLLVRLPEYERKQRLKRHLRQAYLAFKRSSIQIFVGALEGSWSPDIVDQLMRQEAFKAYFKKPFVAGQTGWDGVANRMDDFLVKQLMLEAEVLHGEFQHVMGVIDIRDPEAFAFFKRISETLFRAKHWSAGGDSSDSVLGFFWEVLAGWNWVKGYTERDYVLELIDDL